MYRLRSPTPDVDDELIRGIVIECLDAWLPGCHRHSGGVDDPPVVSPYPDSDFQPRNRHERPCRELAAPRLRARRSSNDCSHHSDHDFWTLARQYGRPPRVATHDVSLTHHHDHHVGLCPWLGYFPLLVLCAIGGLWNYPIFTIPRQVLMAAVPASRRRAALSLDSVSVEICYMIGPTASVIAATTIGTRSTITACGFIAAIGAAGLMVVNPATTEPSQDNPVPSAARTPTSAASVVQAPHNRKMAWLSPQSASILFAVVAAGFCLGGIELTTVAAMRSMGHPEMIGWVLAASGFGSAIGGVLYGALPRGASTALLLVFLGTLTALPALSSGPASTAILLFVGGVFCAPTITSSVDALTDLVPADSRGTIIGWQGSCLNGGTAMAAPLIGAVMDANGWQWGFLVAGIASAIIGATIWTMGWVIRKRQPA